MPVFIPKIAQVAVRRDGIDVVLIVNGRRVVELPWDAALLIAKGITIQARRVEEQLKHSAIAFDQAILMRKGLPIGLTSNPHILKEAKSEALYNPKLRKYIPLAGNIGSQEIVGAPTIIKHKPKPPVVKI